MAESSEDKLVFNHIFTASNPGHIEDYFAFSADKKKKLGEGSYGNVYIAEDKKNGQKRALKSIERSKLKKDRFEAEIAIQQQLDHPNIVRLFQVFMDAKKIYLVMELCTGGELFDRIVEETERHDAEGLVGAFDERVVANYMKQILGAITYCHSKGIAHRDIKPENFLMQNKSRDAPIKVIDFGLAMKFTPGEKMKTKAGTPYYVAPEVLMGGYTEKADIWSCGVIAYVLLCGFPPFYGDTDNEILRAVKRGKFDFPSPEFDNTSESGKNIITQMLEFKEASRPPAAELLQHNWLEDHTDKPQGALPTNFTGNLRKFAHASKMKKVALQIIAQQLDDTQIKELKNTFALLDANNDGTLTVKEITGALAKHDFAEDLGKVLERMDTDGSGSIDYTEFIAASLEKSQYFKDEVLWQAFRTFDKNGDGVISKDELRMVLGSVPEHMIASMIKDADLDGNGDISFEEFKAMMDQPSKIE